MNTAAGKAMMPSIECNQLFHFVSQSDNDLGAGSSVANDLNSLVSKSSESGQLAGWYIPPLRISSPDCYDDSAWEDTQLQ
jgi:hypothetical protein